MNSTSQPFIEQRSALTNYLIQPGYTGPDTAIAAGARLYQQFQHQVSLLAFMDCFRAIAWLTLGAVPLLLLVRRFKTASAPSCGR